MTTQPVIMPNPVPAGLPQTIESQGHSIANAPDGWYSGDAAAAQIIINSYSGSASELSWWQRQQQASLDALFDARFDLAKFIRGGTVTTITATNVGNFLAQITNNYRSLRASIAAATTVAAVQAIDVTTGWPANP